MCGIFRSRDKKEFNKQYVLNLERGASSFGGLFFNKDKTTIFKTDDTRYCPYFAADEYLGHLRAPTGDQRDFSSIHSHPFEYGDWIVAHNGILTNYEELYNDGGDRYAVDSSLIPYYLHFNGFKCFDKFKGTWTCWMYNKKTRELFITRSDNTLFVNPANGDFSSARIEGYEAIEQGKVYKINTTLITTDLEGPLQEVYSYKTKPLYFIP